MVSLSAYVRRVKRAAVLNRRIVRSARGASAISTLRSIAIGSTGRPL
jgi:hypothetical protein